MVVLIHARCENGRPDHNTRDFVEDLSSVMKDNNNGGGNRNAKAVTWRRAKVLELTSQGNSQVEIARTLRVGEPP
jgi:hypothetical protein